MVSHSFTKKKSTDQCCFSIVAYRPKQITLMTTAPHIWCVIFMRHAKQQVGLLIAFFKQWLPSWLTSYCGSLQLLQRNCASIGCFYDSCPLDDQVESHVLVHLQLYAFLFLNCPLWTVRYVPWSSWCFLFTNVYWGFHRRAVLILRLNYTDI